MAKVQLQPVVKPQARPAAGTQVWVFDKGEEGNDGYQWYEGVVDSNKTGEAAKKKAMKGELWVNIRFEGEWCTMYPIWNIKLERPEDGAEPCWISDEMEGDAPMDDAERDQQGQDEGLAPIKIVAVQPRAGVLTEEDAAKER